MITVPTVLVPLRIGLGVCFRGGSIVTTLAIDQWTKDTGFHVYPSEYKTFFGDMYEAKLFAIRFGVTLGIDDG